MQNTKGRPRHKDILTPAEWKVAEGVRHGLSNPQIATRQDVSMNAVKFHVANILSKLGLENRKELQKWDGVSLDSILSGKSMDVLGTELTSIGQIARFVSDIESSVVWYRDLLGLKHLFTHGDLAFFDCEGTRLFLSVGNTSSNSIIYFKVADIHQAYRGLLDKGIEMISAPHMIHKHDDGTEEWMSFFNDLDDQPLAIMSQLIHQAAQE